MTALYSRAIVADGMGGFSLDQVEVAAPEGDEVRVRVEAAGLCHTDWDSIRSWEGPFIVGHEGAGVVEAVGPTVSGLEPGDRVVLNWAIPCGQCATCHAGLFPLCEVNSPTNGDGVSGHARPGATTYRGMSIKRSFNLGTMADYTVVRAAAWQKIAADIPFPVAAIMGCGVMTGYGSVVNVAKVAAGSSVAVIGCGGIGLNVIQACAISGALSIIAIDVMPERLEQARRFGATDTVLSDAGDPTLAKAKAAVFDLTVRGTDYAFECTAIPALGAAPLALIRHGGTAVQVSGIEQEKVHHLEEGAIVRAALGQRQSLRIQCDREPRDLPAITIQHVRRQDVLQVDESLLAKHRDRLRR
jgi:Zn-dependent alcohol dehydrogenase